MADILVVAPHLDDEVLGCGGSIVKHKKKGDRVFVAFVANRVYNHKFDPAKMEVELSHLKNAKKVLGYDDYVYFGLPDEELDNYVQQILIKLEDYISNLKPQVIYSPFHQDNNQDHRAIADAIRVALRPAAATYVKRWLLYETPSSTEQSPPLQGMAFHPNYYADISAELDTKIKALSCYETEARKFPHPRSPEAVRVHAAKRGVEIAYHAAEAFMLIREKAD